MDKEKILRSTFRPVVDYDECTSLPEFLLKKAKQYAELGEPNWLVDVLSGETFQFNSLEPLSRKIGSALFKRGFRKGDIIIFMQIDIVKQPLFLTGVWRANGIGRASYPEEDEETLYERVEESRAGWIYCEPQHAQMCVNVANRIYWDVQVIVAESEDNELPEGCISIYELMEDDGMDLPEADTTFKDTALIMCTSGTTGKSKGAVISQAAILWQFFVTATGFPWPEEKATLICTKATHISGMIISFGSLLVGKTCHFLSSVNRDNIFNAVREYKPALIFGFAPYLLLLVNDPEAKTLDLTDLEVLSSGGAPVTPAIEDALMTLPNLKYVMNVYGLTECAPLVTSTDFDLGQNMADKPTGSIGKLVPGTSAKFINDEGASVGPGEIGEFCVKCSGLFRGYYRNAEASKSAFTDAPYYFRTGDMGYYDENGFIFLVDRAKEIFKYYGNHVSPTELENVILSHPAVAEVCVIAIVDPNGGGHIPRAFCVKAHNEEDATTAEDIMEYANGILAGYKHIRGGVYFVDDLPKGKTGKIARLLVEKIDINEV